MAEDGPFKTFKQFKSFKTFNSFKRGPRLNFCASR